MFEHVDAYAGDPILGLVETFKKDPRDNVKVNLGIGIYYDDQGRLPLLPSVIQAETAPLPADGRFGGVSHRNSKSIVWREL